MPWSLELLLVVRFYSHHVVMSSFLLPLCHQFRTILCCMVLIVQVATECMGFSTKACQMACLSTIEENWLSSSYPTKSSSIFSFVSSTLSSLEASMFSNQFFVYIVDLESIQYKFFHQLRRFVFIHIIFHIFTKLIEWGVCGLLMLL